MSTHTCEEWQMQESATGRGKYCAACGRHTDQDRKIAPMADPTQTPPPLDLIADLKELSAGHHSQANVLVWNVSLSALIARVEELEAEREDLMQKTQRIARGDQAFRDLGLEHRANCYALLMQDNENLNRGLHTSGLENVKLTARAEAAEAKIAAVRASVLPYYEVGGHVCDDLDEDCARCVADEAMDALDGTA